MTLGEARRADDGAGLLSTTTGVLVFLVLLLLAVQVVFSLYATSVVTAAAYDGARLAAGSDAAADVEALDDAEAHVVRVLGRYGRDRAKVDASIDGDDIVVHVRARHPGFLPSHLRRPMGLDVVDRTARVRIER